MRRRSRYLGRALLFTTVALIGIGTPLKLEYRAAGLSVAVKSAVAEKGSGGGDDRGGGSSGRGGDRSGGGQGSGNRGGDRGGDDRGDDDRGGDDRGGGAASDGNTGHGGQDRGRGRGLDNPGHPDADDEGRDRGRGDDEAAGGTGPADEGRGRGGDDGRPAAEVDLSDDDLAGVLAGRRTLIDDRGRVLEVEVEVEDGRRTVSVKPHGGAARRDPGPINAVRAVDPQAGITHGVRVKGAARGATAGARAVVRSGDDDPRQVGDDLSRGEEEALIQSGWR